MGLTYLIDFEPTANINHKNVSDDSAQEFDLI